MNLLKNKKNLSFLLIGAAVIFVMLLSQCTTKGGRAGSILKGNTDDNVVVLSDAQFKNAPVTAALMSERHISTVMKLNGKIDVPPQNMVSVSLPLGGYLKSTQLLPGMKVSKGETIAIIENPQFIQLQQDYLIAKSKLKFAEEDYNRQRALNETKASSDKVMQQAYAEMNVQRTTMQALAQQLKLININPGTLHAENIQKSVPVYSMINGFVSKVNVNIGKYVNPTEVLFELIDPTDIHLNLMVYEKDLGRLKIGQSLQAYTNGNPEKKYPAKIILISKDVNASGISEVHCHFEKYDAHLIPGMYMNAEIQLGNSFSNSIAEESIVNFEGKNYVFVEEKKQTYRMVPVSIGESESGFVQILNYTDFTGKKIVTKNAYTLLMKLKNVSGEEE